MKKNQNGISIISIVLLIFIIIVAGIIYTSIENNEREVELAYENYYQEQVYNQTNEAKRYYYNQISKPAKIMYDTILMNIDLIKSGTESIKFPSTVGDSINEIETSENDNYFQTAWDALSLDNLNLFFVDTKKLSVSTKTTSILGYRTYEFTLEPINGTTYYSLSFNNKSEVDTALNKVESVANSIISEAKGSTYAKVKYVHDWIVDNVEYDNEGLENHDNIYGTFINRKVVCEGYAEAFKYLLDKLNIPCVLVYGDGYDSSGNIEAHAWNYVKMDDGKWYAVDTTWDDPIYIGGSGIFASSSRKYEYFLKGSNSFNSNHKNDGDVSGTGQNFAYPELSTTDYAR